MFKEMTTKKKIIIGVIVLVVIICIILFIINRKKKKKQAATNKAEESIQRTVSAPVVVENKRSQIVPEEDLQAVKSTPETKLSVEAVIPEKKEPAAAAPVNNNSKAPTTPAPYKSVMGEEFMQNANEQN